MTANTSQPANALAEVSLIDATACAAVGSMSISWWHEEVRAGRAPQPAIRKTRCTRWRVSEVRDFWASFAEGSADGADKVMEVAKKASTAAKSKRVAALPTTATDGAVCPDRP